VTLNSRYTFPPPVHDLREIYIMDSVPQLHVWRDPIDCVSERFQFGAHRRPLTVTMRYDLYHSLSMTWVPS